MLLTPNLLKVLDFLHKYIYNNMDNQFLQIITEEVEMLEIMLNNLQLTLNNDYQIQARTVDSIASVSF